MQERSWWYRTTLSAPKVSTADELVLDFGVVDCVATLFVDGQEVATHASQHRPFEVVTSLTPGEHEVLVRFDPPLWGLSEPPGPRATRDRMRDYFESQGAYSGEGEGSGVMTADLSVSLRRKALWSWGWDFAPNLPSIGLLNQPRLITRPIARIRRVSARTSSVTADAGPATLAVRLDAVSLPSHASVRWRLIDADGVTVVDEETPLSTAAETTLRVPSARLWWTHDLGEPHLYTLEAQVSANGATVAGHHQRVGLRTLELDERRCDDGGRRFQFVLNGVHLFARGAAWVPPSMLPGSVTDAHVRHLVTLAQASNMTMLRVWGGGMYPPDAFYDACDELGLLVWQDLMFACMDYPDQDPTLVKEVTAEVRHQVARLGSRPCLAVWVGNNEASALHEAIWPDTPTSGWGERFYDDLFPRIIAEIAPGSLYRRGSPHGSIGSANGVLDGDRHAWEVWHGADVGAGPAPADPDPGMAVHFWRYAQDTGRFISEFGLHAAPELTTLTRWTDEDLTPGEPAWNHRIKDTPKDKGAALLATETGSPTSLRSYLTASMMVQAEGLTFGISHYRRRQPDCAGTLVWQFNDSWPGLSWSVIDFDGVPKAAWYALRRVFSPVLVSLKHVGSDVEVWVSNSTDASVEIDVDVRVRTFEGQTFTRQTFEHQTSERRRCADTVAPNTARCVGRIAAPEDVRSAYVEAVETASVAPRARLFLTHLKHLPLGGTVEYTVHADADDRRHGRARVDITAHGFAYAVRVEPAWRTMVSSDAYFDLADSETVSVHLSGLPEDVDHDEIEVRTWADDWS